FVHDQTRYLSGTARRNAYRRHPCFDIGILRLSDQSLAIYFGYTYTEECDDNSGEEKHHAGPSGRNSSKTKSNKSVFWNRIPTLGKTVWLMCLDEGLHYVGTFYIILGIF